MASEQKASEFSAKLNTNFDIKRLAGSFMSHWYWLVISLAVALAAGWLYLRYTSPVYTVQSTLLFQPQNEMQEQVLNTGPQFNDGMADRLMFNEIFVMSSQDLVSDVINTLNLNTHYYVKGNVKESELYKRSPIQITVDSQLANGNISLDFHVRQKSTNHFTVTLDKKPYEIAADKWLKLPALGAIKINYSRSSEAVNDYLKDDIRVSYEPLMQATKNIQQKLMVQPADARTSMIGLSMNDEIPQRGLDFLNTLISLYHRNELENLNYSTQKQKEYIGLSMSNLQDELRHVDVRVEDIKQANATVDPSAEASTIFQNKLTADQQLNELRNQKQSLENLSGDLNRYMSAPQVIAGVGVTDPNLLSLITEYNNAVQLANNLKISEGEQSPKLARIESRIGTLRNSLLDAVQHVKRQVDININRVQQDAGRFQSKIYAAPQLDKTLKEATRNYTTLQEMYLMLFQKDLEADIKASTTTNRSKVVIAPYASPTPVFPIPLNIYVICAILGLLIPSGYLVAKELLNNKIYNERELQAITNIPLIGSIAKDKSGTTIVVGERNRSAIAEQFRLIRTNLEFFSQGMTKKTMLVTSSIPGEGKTFVSINLGITLALGGKRVIVMEFDLRKPKISEYLGISKEGGISGYLAGLCGLDKVVKSSDIHPNLYVANCGPIPPNPGELLISPKVQQLLDDLQEMFDVVIIDTAPVALVSDALVLAKYTSLNLFVVRQNYTFKSQVSDFTQTYNDGRINNAAIVFNFVEMKQKYGYSYGYGYGYGDKGYFVEADNKKLLEEKA